MEYRYDLAISLLDEDVQLGWDIVNSLGNPEKVFFYAKDTDELTFNNGVNVFGDVFSTHARFVLVLHRERYGQTDWTALENSIIQERFIKTVKENNSPILFCKLDKSPKPNWLPNTYIYGSISPLDNLIKILRKKITDFGGNSFPQTSEEKLRLVVEKNKYEQSFLHKTLSNQELADSARAEAFNFRDKLRDKLNKNATDNGLFYNEKPDQITFSIPIAYLNASFDKLNIILRDNQTASNSISDAFIEITVRKGDWILKNYKKKFYITINGIKGWRNFDNKNFLTSEGLIEIIFQEIISIMSGKENQNFVL